MCLLLFLIHLLAVPALGLNDSLCRLRGRFDLPRLSKDGDIVIGGSFNIHYYRKEQFLDFRSPPGPPVCKSFDLTQFQFAQTMIYTIEEINKNQTLIPNIKLGYQIHDGCGDPAMSTKVTTLLISGQEETLADPKCKTTSNIPAIVTDAESMQSVAVARVITPFNVTMFSYSAAYDYLNNMYEFPTFFRTIPNDYHQVDGLAQLVKYFGWNWIGTIRSNSTYGALAMDEIIKAMESLGICIAFSEAVHKTDSKEKLQSLIKIIKEATTKIIVAFVAQADMAVLLQEIVRQNVTGIQWIGSESWITMPGISPQKDVKFLAGTVGFAVPKAKLPGLKEFLLEVHPSKYPRNVFVSEFWETTFECVWQKPDNLTQTDSDSEVKFCTGDEKLEEVDNQYTDTSQLRIAYNVYKAVYAIAHSLNNMLSKTNFTFTQLDLWELLHYMYAVNFTARNGESIYFDPNLDTVPLYELVNWQMNSEGVAHVMTIGHYDGLVPFDKRLYLNKENIIWINGKKEVPRGVCSDSCLPGTWKTVRKEMPLCCFTCIPCSDGEISNVTDSVSCLKCPSEYWSNQFKTQCVPKKIEFLSFDDEMGSSLLTLAVIGTCLTVATAIIFYKHRQTPLVKANNSEEFRFAQTMIFAIEEINRSTKLLPNVTLGYQIYDGCSSETQSVKAVMALISTQNEARSDLNCTVNSKVPALFADAGFVSSLAETMLTRPFGISTISFTAMCQCFGDHEFPTLFETVPSDSHQIAAITTLVKHFGWNWVGLIQSSSTYITMESETILSLLERMGICTAFQESFSDTDSKDKIQQIVKRVKEATTKIIIAFATLTDMEVLLQEVVRQNLTGIQWIASDSWVTAPILSPEENARFLVGTLGFIIPKADIPGLKEFLLQVNPNQSPANPLINEFWEKTFHCSMQKLQNGTQCNPESHVQQCTGNELLETIDNAYTYTSQLRSSYRLYKAVYVIAHALHNIFSCGNDSCLNMSDIQPWQASNFRVMSLTRQGLHVTNIALEAFHCCSEKRHVNPSQDHFLRWIFLLKW
ncbi:hypothetical protein chiPu_0017031 [Chiloscyllium punctatum]|uniref:G-protein coupled receptors family 3 profile domain-containing protein n=1 Tax=Chiloscyllium punctatum TaxID=137246 RepID=A0A401T7D5_CHIPU|nr:hypothetical protein [Chiloscyllium punctatum]